MRPLFVGGCQRSGTSAFVDYLNQHREVLLCQDRYKTMIPAKITPALFTFERILNYRPGEAEPPWKLDFFIQEQAEILAKKDPAKLKWIGDKSPRYVRYMDALAGNNPGARFIALYRPIEEVVESWDVRAKDPDDHWPSHLGFKLAVETWNLSLRKMREFVESSPAPRLLIISYHDFFYRNEAVVPLISRFLGLEFDESVTKAWREASLEFEGARRSKQPLSEEQRSFIEEHADRAAEAWVLERIERQWREPELYAEEDTEAALASLKEIEAKMWRLQRELQTERQKQQRTQRHLEELRGQNQKEVKKLSRTLARARKKNRKLTHRLQSIQASRTWRLLNKLRRIKYRLLRRNPAKRPASSERSTS